MALQDHANKVADTFEYGPEELNKGVKEFLNQMGQHALQPKTPLVLTDVSQMRACPRLAQRFSKYQHTSLQYLMALKRFESSNPIARLCSRG